MSLALPSATDTMVHQLTSRRLRVTSPVSGLRRSGHHHPSCIYMLCYYQSAFE